MPALLIHRNCEILNGNYLNDQVCGNFYSRIENACISHSDFDAAYLFFCHLAYHNGHNILSRYLRTLLLRRTPKKTLPHWLDLPLQITVVC